MSDQYFDIIKEPGEYAGYHPVAANVEIRPGGLAALDVAGNALEAGATGSLFVVGRTTDRADNTGGAAGDKKVLAERGIYHLANDDTDPVDRTHINTVVFATAPDTVASTGTCRAGVLLGFSAGGLPIVDTNQTTNAQL